MNIKNFIHEIYFDKTPLKARDYEKSRRLFIYEGCTAVGIFSLTSGAFLAGFANYMGASDEFNGIIGAIPALTGVIQMFSSIIFEKLEKRKFLVSIDCFIFRLMLSSIVLIPLVFQITAARLTVLAVIYGMANLISSFINPPSSNWIIDLTPEHLRGKYLARKDAVALVFLTVLTVIVGKIMDLFKAAHNEYGGFLAIGVFVLILTLSNTYFLAKVKEPTGHRKVMKVKLKDTLSIPFKNTRYRKVIILFLLWNIGIQIGGPFFSVYMVTGLKLNYTYIMIMGVLGSMVRAFTAKYWGRIADKRSWFFSTKLSIALLAIAHAGWLLVDDKTLWVILPIINIIGGIAWSGVNISIFNIQFVMAPKEGRTMYLGASSALGGLAGFISTLIGSIIIKYLKNFSFVFVGLHLGNMHMVFALSGIILFVTALYVHLCLSEKAVKTK
jgi:MFS family permease